MKSIIAVNEEGNISFIGGVCKKVEFKENFESILKELGIRRI